MRSVLSTGLGLVLITGCAAEPGRVQGPGAFVAGVGSGLVNAHDAVARRLLGDAAKPMLIAPPPPQTPADSRETTSAHALAASATVAHRQAVSAETSWVGLDDVTSADLDGDGTVSLDEILLLGRSGLSDVEVAERLERTGRTFELSTSQEQYHRVRGISEALIARLPTLNRSITPPPPQRDITTVRVGDASK